MSNQAVRYSYRLKFQAVDAFEIKVSILKIKKSIVIPRYLGTTIFFCCFLFLPAGLLRCLGAGTRGRCVESEFEREMRDNQIAREK